jgi:hypothetical protein
MKVGSVLLINGFNMYRKGKVGAAEAVGEIFADDNIHMETVPEGIRVTSKFDDFIIPYSNVRRFDPKAG